jgi:hypothetical protein
VTPRRPPPPLPSLNPAPKYCVMIPNPLVPQGKRLLERLRNLLLLLVAEPPGPATASSFVRAATVSSVNPPSSRPATVSWANPRHPPSVVRTPRPRPRLRPPGQPPSVVRTRCPVAPSRRPPSVLRIPRLDHFWSLLPASHRQFCESDGLGIAREMRRVTGGSCTICARPRFENLLRGRLHWAERNGRIRHS